MWWFAGGLYMMQLAPGSLRLTALYGLIIAATVICFGASVGNWIDKTKRIYAARTFLAIQNLCVSICALGISWFLWIYGTNSGLIQSSADMKPVMLNETYKEDPELFGDYNTTTDDPASTLSNLPSFETAKLVTIIGVIMFSSIARLASSGTVIILQKDWIVVIADNDTDYLARINSILRTIELTTYMLAPIISGQLFYFIGYIWTGVFIAIWNIVSVVGEYALLQGIYNQYPRLAHKINSYIN
jgi:iron-regulated transporter 1